jgi:hypothetical protein
MASFQTARGPALKHPRFTQQEKAALGKMQKMQLLNSFRTCENTSRSAHRKGLSGILS